MSPTLSRVRRDLLRSVAATLASSCVPGAWAQHSALPAAAALRDEAQTAAQAGQPLVVMVSLEGCVFCKVVRENFLLPLQRRGLPVVQVDMRSARRLTDFQGQPLTHDELVRRWGIRAAPTLLFMGPQGSELAPRLVGASIPDFYGAYLEERLQQARQALKTST